MIREKEKIIKRFGTTVLIKYKDGTTKQTKGLVERAKQNSASFIVLEALRKGDFLVADNVENGCIIYNLANGEKYLVIGIYPFVFKDDVLSTVANLVVTNATLTVKQIKEVADTNGNIRKIPIDVIKDLECYVQKVNYQYKQLNPGININTDYVIYAPKIDLNSLDKITITADGKTYNLKVIACNNFLFDGLSYIEATNDIGK